MSFGLAAHRGRPAGPRRRRWSLPFLGVVVGLVAAVAPVAACAHTPCPPELTVQDSARMDAELRRLTQEHPDSVVGVLVRLRTAGNGPRRAELESAGLSVGTIVGEIATGRLRACDAPRVARLASVRYVELAREVPRAPGPDAPNP